MHSNVLVKRAKQNKMILSNYIEQNPAILVGKPLIKGTRISVAMILEKLAAGQSEEEILSDYPRLTKEKIRAALAFAASFMQEFQIKVTPKSDH